MLVFDYLALVKLRGTGYAFIFSILAFGMAFVTLTATALSNPIQYSGVTITGTAGNTVIPAYNTTSQLAPTTLHFLLPTLNLVIIVHFVLVFVSIGNIFLYARKRRYGVK